MMREEGGRGSEAAIEVWFGYGCAVDGERFALREGAVRDREGRRHEAGFGC